MQFKRPSSIDRHFQTPPGCRPTIELAVSAIPYLLPANLRDLDMAPTRLADYIIGFSQDEAARQGVKPGEFTSALEAGSLAMQAFVFRTNGVVTHHTDAQMYAKETEAACIVSLNVLSAGATITGGLPDECPTSIVYNRRGAFYHPFRAITVVNDRPTECNFENYYSYIPPNGGDKEHIPDEFRAARHMHNMAKFIEGGLSAGAIAVRADLSSTVFGDLRGRGLR